MMRNMEATRRSGATVDKLELRYDARQRRGQMPSIHPPDETAEAAPGADGAGNAAGSGAAAAEAAAAPPVFAPPPAEVRSTAPARARLGTTFTAGVLDLTTHSRRRASCRSGMTMVTTPSAMTVR